MLLNGGERRILFSASNASWKRNNLLSSKALPSALMDFRFALVGMLLHIAISGVHIATMQKKNTRRINQLAKKSLAVLGEE